MWYDVPEGLWATLGVLITAAITYLGFRMTQRQAARQVQVQEKAQTVANDLEEDRLQVEFYQGLVDRLDGRLARVEKRLEEVEAQLSTMRQDRDFWQNAYRRAARALRDLHHWVVRTVPPEVLAATPPPALPTDVPLASDLA